MSHRIASGVKNEPLFHIILRTMSTNYDAFLGVKTGENGLLTSVSPIWLIHYTRSGTYTERIQIDAYKEKILPLHVKCLVLISRKYIFNFQICEHLIIGEHPPKVSSFFMKFRTEHIMHEQSQNRVP